MRILYIIIFIIFSLISKESYAACSDASGKATINEVYKLTTGSGTASFVEIKLIDETVTSAVYDEWTLNICYGSGCVTYNVSDFTDSLPWLYIQAPSLDDDYLDFKKGFDITLRGDTTDNGGADSQEVIDYFVTDSFFSQNLNGCSTGDLPYWLGSQSTNNGTKIAKRIGDGTGSWVIVNSNDDSETPGASNDGVQVDHFRITHDGSGLTCETESVVIEACANSDCTILSTYSLTLDFQGNGSTISSPTFTGSTTVNFNHTTAETLTLSVANPSIALENSLVCDDGSGTSCDIVFADAGFLISMTSGESCQNHNVTIQAVKKSETGTSCAPLYVGNQQVDLGFKYISPNVGSTIPNIDTVALAIAGATQTRTLNFDASATANVTIHYKDAGEIELNASATVASGALAGLNLSGSDTATYHPNKLVVTAKNDSGVLNVVNSIDTPIQKAGRDFTIDISAQCIGNSITKNYIPQANDRIELSAKRTAPTLGTDGTLIVNGQEVTLGSDLSGFTNIELSASSFTDGESTITASYDEVGLLQIDAQDKNYNSQLISAVTADIGRFIPDHFAVSSQFVGNSCGNVTYMDEPAIELTYEIKAKNSNDLLTQNYTGDFAKSSVILVAENSNDGIDLASARLTGYAGGWANGIYTNEENKVPEIDLVTFIREPTPIVDGPFDNLLFGVKLTNTEGAALNSLDMRSDTVDACTTGINSSTDCSAKLLSSTESKIRFGRWVLENTFGPETNDLPISMAIQYWNGSSFVINSLDTCTTFDAVNLSVDDTNLSPGPATVSASGSGTFVDGETKSIILSAPGSPHQGAVPISYVIPSMPWLLYDWTWDGVSAKEFNENPSATATFGLFRGNDRIIYQREVNN